VTANKENISSRPGRPTVLLPVPFSGSFSPAAKGNAREGRGIAHVWLRDRGWLCCTITGEGKDRKRALSSKWMGKPGADLGFGPSI
jgi:hypothetical protein